MIQTQENADNRLETQASEGYEIKVDTVGFADHTLNFDPYLFNRSKHLATQRRKNPVSIGLRRTQDHQIAAVLHLDQMGTEATSPALAPFGGIQAISGLSEEILTRVLEAADDWCRAYRIGRIVIKTHSEAYDQGQSALFKSVYIRGGFIPTATHMNHHIRVTTTHFEDTIRSSERRRLHKCVRAGFTAEIWQDPDPAQVYAFLAESRQRQGYPFSLDLAQLSLLLTQFPQHALVFVVKDQTEVVSLTVGIRVSTKILYNFCPADNLHYRSYSPMVLLNGYLYEYAQRTGIELIDLGVSLDHLGHEKTSLMRFKENLGAEKSEKVTYEKFF